MLLPNQKFTGVDFRRTRLEAVPKCRCGEECPFTFTIDRVGRPEYLTEAVCARSSCLHVVISYILLVLLS